MIWGFWVLNEGIKHLIGQIRPIGQSKKQAIKKGETKLKPAFNV